MVDKQKIKWFGISGIILVVLFFFADLTEIIEALSSASPRFILLGLVSGILPFLIWNFTWYRLINEVGLKISYREVLPVFMSGEFLNRVTPLGQFGGEPFMAYILSRNTDLSYEKAFPAVFSSDIINFIPAFTFIIAGALILFSEITNIRLLRNIVTLGLIIAGFGGLTTYLLFFKAELFEKYILKAITKFCKLTGRGNDLLPKIEEKFISTREAFDMIGENPGNLLLTAGVAHLAFIFNVLCLYFVLLSIGINAELTLLIFALPLSSVASISPTPGGSGTFEGAMALILTVLIPISFSQALASAIIFRALTYLPPILIGYMALTKIEASK